MSAWLYRSGKLLPVSGEHCDMLAPLGFASVTEAVAAGFVRIRRVGHTTAFQARSRDLLRSAAREFFQTEQPTTTTAIEFPGRYLELSADELCEFL